MEAASDHTYLIIVIEIACILLQVGPSPPYQSLCKIMQAISIMMIR
jgi:hypothetical protein